MKNTAIVIWILLAFISMGCQPLTATNQPVKSKTVTAAPSDVKWDATIDQFVSDYFAANPTIAVSYGKHEYDGKFPDWSEQGLKNELQRLQREHEKIAQIKEPDLTEDQIWERHYLLQTMEGEVFWRDEADLPHTSPFWYAGFLDPDVYVSRPYAPLETRIKSYTEYARNIPNALKQIKINLKMPMPRTFVKIGRKSIGGLADVYEKDVPKAFEPVKDPQLQKDFRKANDGAIKAVRDFDSWLGKQESKANDNFALGDEKFATMLDVTEDVGTELPELEGIAKKDLDRNTKALQAECAKFAPEQTLSQCVAKVSADRVTAANMVETASKQLADLRKFLQEKNIVTIPGTEEIKAAQGRPNKAWNFAYTSFPGPYETNLPSVYYLSAPDPSWPKEKQVAYLQGNGKLLFTTVREVYPGHFVHFLNVNRSKSKIAQIYISRAFADGWAHYCEEMMYDLGLGSGDPKVHIAQLQEALLRNVRFISAIGLHTKGMTVAESKKMFIEQGLQDDGNAQQEAERGTYDPGYLKDTMGKLIIRKLRDDWCASRGGPSAWKQFHDTFLSYGGPPIRILRKHMMGPDDEGSLF